MDKLPEFTPWPKIARLNREIVITEKLDGTNAAIHIEEFDCVEPNGEGHKQFRVTAQSRNRILQPGKHTDNFGFAAWVQKNAEVLYKALGVGLHFGEWWGVGIGRGYGLTERRFSLFNVAKWGEGSEGAVGLALARSLGVALYAVPMLYTGPWTGCFGYKNGANGEWLDLSVQNWPTLSEEQAALNAEIEHMYSRIEELTTHNLRGILDVPGRKYLSLNPRPRYAPNFIIEWLARVGSQAAPGFERPEGIVVFHKASGQMFKATVEKDEQWKGGNQ